MSYIISIIIVLCFPYWFSNGKKWKECNMQLRIPVTANCHLWKKIGRIWWLATYCTYEQQTAHIEWTKKKEKIIYKIQLQEYKYQSRPTERVLNNHINNYEHHQYQKQQTHQQIATQNTRAPISASMYRTSGGHCKERIHGRVLETKNKNAKINWSNNFGENNHHDMWWWI